MTTVFVPVFGGSHYESWSIRMKTLLKAMDLWDVVETGIQQEPPEEISSTCREFEGESYASTSSSSYEWKKWMEMKDMTALYMIQIGLTIETFQWIASARSSKEAWELLLVRSLGGPMFRARKLLDLKKEYDRMTMSDADTIHEFTGKLMELVSRMKYCGWEVEDKEVLKKILSSLPLRFGEVFFKIEGTLSISKLIDYLLVLEYSMKAVQESVIESVDAKERLQDEPETLNSSNYSNEVMIPLAEATALMKRLIFWGCIFWGFIVWLVLISRQWINY